MSRGEKTFIKYLFSTIIACVIPAMVGFGQQGEVTGFKIILNIICSV